jgi:hypothetical protein
MRFCDAHLAGVSIATVGLVKHLCTVFGGNGWCCIGTAIVDNEDRTHRWHGLQYVR